MAQALESPVANGVPAPADAATDAAAAEVEAVPIDAPTANGAAAEAEAPAAASTAEAEAKPAAAAAEANGNGHAAEAGDDVSSEEETEDDRERRTRALLRGASALDLKNILAPVVICGPSGVGKGTIIAELMARHPAKFSFCVSHTTRGPRPGEVDGQHYHFVDMDMMQLAVKKGAFLEHAHVHGNMYGTSLASVAAVSAQGKVAILDIDVQGAEQVRASCLGSHSLFLFVAPPSHEELERRLRGRGTETEEKVLKRLANAASEIEKSKTPGLFNKIIVNNQLETAILEVSAAIEAHRPGTVPGAAEALAKHLAAEAAATVAAAVAAAAAEHAAAAVPAAPATAAAIARHAAPSPPGPAANGTPAGSLLDLGFGSPSGGVKGSLPVRAYMDATVVPVLREGLKALNSARPEDPLQFLAEFLLAQRAAREQGAPLLLPPAARGPGEGAARAATVGPVA